MPAPAVPPSAPEPRAPDHRRAAWIVTIALSLTLLTLPIGLGLLLSAGGDSGSSAQAAGESTQPRSKSDREARVVFHLRPGAMLGMRILRKAPADTLAVRGKRVRVLCGSVSGLIERPARWPRGDATLRVQLPAQAYSASEFCALKRGAATVASVIFE